MDKQNNTFEVNNQEMTEEQLQEQLQKFKNDTQLSEKQLQELLDGSELSAELSEEQLEAISGGFGSGLLKAIKKCFGRGGSSSGRPYLPPTSATASNVHVSNPNQYSTPWHSRR